MKTEKMKLDEEALDARYKCIDMHRNIIFADIVRLIKAKRKVQREFIDALCALYNIEENLGRAKND